MDYKIAKYFSSFEFYKMLNDLDYSLKVQKQDRVVLDFSEVNRIEALVIPNLLLLGRYIKEKTGYIPYVRLGANLNAGYLKKYLQGINFLELSSRFYRYESDGFSEGYGKEMDPLNTTAYFAQSDGEDVARRRIYYDLYPFVQKYLGDFDTKLYNCESLDIHTFENNIIASFIEEIILNAFEHGKSDAIVTVQANYKKRKIFLAISDFGEGFQTSTKALTTTADNNAYNVLGKKPQTEAEGIILGIYKRKHSKKYGLYNVVRRVLQLNGLIRIHSNYEQLIITTRLLDSFLDEKLYEVIRDSKYNFVKTGKFAGTHIEIELPF